MEAQVGWFESLPSGGTTFQQQPRRNRRFTQIIALRGKKLTRRCFRTPINERGYPSEGMPLHVTFPMVGGVASLAQSLLRRRNLRISLKLEKWSDRRNPRSVERTAYRITGGSLYSLLEEMEKAGFKPPKADKATGRGVWHVSC